MKDYVLNYKEKKCVIDGKDISYKEIYLEFNSVDVKVSIPKELKTQVISSIDDGECYLRVDYDGTVNCYNLLLSFGEYLIPLNNKIFTPLELYTLINF